MEKMVEELKLPKAEEPEEKVEPAKIEEEDVLTHNLDREEGLGDEVAKDVEDAKGAVEKELVDRKEGIEKEINDAKAEKPEMKTGDNKKFVIKGLKEGVKLTLEEPTDVLNESLDDYDGFTKLDILQTEYDIDAQALLDHIAQWLPESDLNNCINDFIVDNDMDDLFEGLQFPSKEPLTEAEINEKIPVGLAKAYNYQGTPHAVEAGRYSYNGNNKMSKSDTDWENAEYEEVSPEEGFKIYKKDPTSIRLYFKGDGSRSNRYVDFRDNGYVSVEHRLRYVDNDKAYTKKNGEVVTDTARMPIKHLFAVADRVYHTNERTTKRNRDVAAERAKNPESPNFNNSNVGTEYRYSIDDTPVRGSSKGYHDWDDVNRYRNYVKGYKKQLAELEARHNAGEVEDEYYNYKKQDLIDEINSTRDSMKRIAGDLRDNAAFNRNLASEIALKEPFVKYREIKNELRRAESKLASANTALERAKENGSPKTREAREKYNELMIRMKDLRRRIAMCELDLEDTDEDDAAAVKQAEEDVNTIQTNMNDLTLQLKALLGR